MKGTIPALAVAGALMLAGCGGGSKSASMAGGPSPTPTPTPAPTFGPGPIPLPQGHTLQTGTITIPAGGEPLPVREADNEKTVIRCSAGSENCTITVAADGTVTLIAGSLRIEIQGVPVVTTPPIPPVQVETPPTPPTMVYESPLVSWRELPALVDRYDHWTHMQVGVHTPPGPSCDDGVTACRALVKSRLAAATEDTSGLRGALGWHGGEAFGGRAASWQGKLFFGTRPDPSRDTSPWGGWLDNSIFIAERNRRFISMGIGDANPVTGVYRGDAVNDRGRRGYFELNYTSGATGGQLSAMIALGGNRGTIYPTDTHPGRPGNPMIWSNVPVNSNGAFDNGLRPAADRRPGPNQLTGKFYRGGEVGGVFHYHHSDTHVRISGAFGGKLSPDGP